jgi:hypothetical protein
MLARFPGGWSNVPQEHPATTDWMQETFYKAKTRPDIGAVYTWAKGDTPVPMIRNHCIEVCKQLKADLLLIIDSDMNADAYLHTNRNKIGIDLNAKPFFDTALDFILNRYHREPCVVAAPYCGPSPAQNLYVFHWSNWNSGRPKEHANKDFYLQQYTRHEAAQKGGIEEVAAIPTGLCLIDMRVFRDMPHPHFYYEWEGDGKKCEHCGCRKPGIQMKKSSTEDVAWSRDIAMHYIASDGRAGGRIYCNWDAWAGHYKLECVGKPTLLSVDEVAPRFIEAVQRNQKLDDKLIVIGEDRYDPSIPIASMDFQQGKREPKDPALANGQVGDAQPQSDPEPKS